MKHYKITVTGIVQGVSFRYYTQDKAKQLGLKGFVTNQANGTVYIEAEGEEKTLKLFEKWCYEGSPMSTVEKVEKIEGDLKNFDNFQITW